MPGRRAGGRVGSCDGGGSWGGDTAGAGGRCGGLGVHCRAPRGGWEGRSGEMPAGRMDVKAACWSPAPTERPRAPPLRQQARSRLAPPLGKLAGPPRCSPPRPAFALDEPRRRISSGCERARHGAMGGPVGWLPLAAAARRRPCSRRWHTASCRLPSACCCLTNTLDLPAPVQLPTTPCWPPSAAPRPRPSACGLQAPPQRPPCLPRPRTSRTWPPPVRLASCPRRPAQSRTSESGLWGPRAGRCPSMHAAAELRFALCWRLRLPTVCQHSVRGLSWPPASHLLGADQPLAVTAAACSLRRFDFGRPKTRASGSFSGPAMNGAGSQGTHSAFSHTNTGACMCQPVRRLAIWRACRASCIAHVCGQRDSRGQVAGLAGSTTCTHLAAHDASMAGLVTSQPICPPCCRVCYCDAWPVSTRQQRCRTWGNASEPPCHTPRPPCHTPRPPTEPS